MLKALIGLLSEAAAAAATSVAAVAVAAGGSPAASASASRAPAAGPTVANVAPGRGGTAGRRRRAAGAPAAGGGGVDGGAAAAARARVDLRALLGEDLGGRWAYLLRLLGFTYWCGPGLAFLVCTRCAVRLHAWLAWLACQTFIGKRDARTALLGLLSGRLGGCLCACCAVYQSPPFMGVRMLNTGKLTCERAVCRRYLLQASTTLCTNEPVRRAQRVPAGRGAARALAHAAPGAARRCAGRRDAAARGAALRPGAPALRRVLASTSAGLAGPRCARAHHCLHWRGRGAGYAYLERPSLRAIATTCFRSDVHVTSKPRRTHVVCVALAKWAGALANLHRVRAWACPERCTRPRPARRT